MGAKNIQVMDMPKPEINPDEVLIKVKYCGICGSDVAAYKTGAYVPGLIIGHEFSGEIVEKGSQVYNLEVGDRVTANGVNPCGCCYYCQHNNPSLCENLQMPGVSINGAFAEYVALPAKIVYKLPDNISDQEAALIDPFANALHGVRRSNFKPGDKTLILGCGPIGIFTIISLKIAGATEIYASEISDVRRSLASKMGATATINPKEENIFTRMEELTQRGPDIIFECAGVPQTLKDAVTLVRPGGQIVVISIQEHPVEFDFMTLTMNELSIIGTYAGYEEYPIAIKYLEMGLVDVKPLITRIIPLEKIVKEGFERLVQPNIKDMKILVKIG